MCVLRSARTSYDQHRSLISDRYSSHAGCRMLDAPAAAAPAACHLLLYAAAGEQETGDGSLITVVVLPPLFCLARVRHGFPCRPVPDDCLSLSDEEQRPRCHDLDNTVHDSTVVLRVAPNLFSETDDRIRCGASQFPAPHTPRTP